MTAEKAWVVELGPDEDALEPAIVVGTEEEARRRLDQAHEGAPHLRNLAQDWPWRSTTPIGADERRTVHLLLGAEDSVEVFDDAMEAELARQRCSTPARVVTAVTNTWLGAPPEARRR